MKYIKVEWPEIQDYMDNPNYPEECYFDPEKNIWFVPEDWESNCRESYYDDTEEYKGGDIGDLEDALG